MDKEKLLVSAILFNHNVPINEAKIIGAFIEKLEQQCKKQKEVIDKVYELIKQHIRKDGFLELNEWQTRDLLNILKEVSE